MPVNEKQTKGEVIYQRGQYNKGGITRWYWDYKDNIVLEQVADHGTIVDLGCGEGVLLEKLVKKFPNLNIIGIDIMLENVEICQKRLLPARQGNLYDLDIKDGSIDVVILMEVIEHLENAPKAIKEIYRILKSNGKLIVIFPNDAFFYFARLMTFKFKEAAYNPGHTRQWTHSDINQLLLENGLKVLSARSIPFFFWPICLHGIVLAKKPSGDI
jgi:2-polyprenyl-3-methyl-5-hydroxy-6-metoxy-1,4-benzoquinol methylase